VVGFVGFYLHCDAQPAHTPNEIVSR
jgi:hypothetical protein